MIGRTYTSIVKWISCKIILVISQSQAPFVNFTEHILFLLVILMVNIMLSLIKSKRYCFLCAYISKLTIWSLLEPGRLTQQIDDNICYNLSLYKKSRVKTFDHPSSKI